MANPQLEDGRTEVANELAEAFARLYLSPSESGELLRTRRAGPPAKFRLEGVCKCGEERWRWRIVGAFIKLRCVGCGRSIEFACSLPLISVLTELKKLAREARKEVAWT